MNPGIQCKYEYGLIRRPTNHKQTCHSTNQAINPYRSIIPMDIYGLYPDWWWFSTANFTVAAVWASFSLLSACKHCLGPLEQGVGAMCCNLADTLDIPWTICRCSMFADFPSGWIMMDCFSARVARSFILCRVSKDPATIMSKNL